MMQQEYSANKQRITIKLKTLNNTVYEIIVNRNSQVASIQGKVQENTGVPVCAQRLLFKGCLLQPLKKLSEYNVSQGSVIKLVANRIPSQVSSPSTYRQSQVIKSNKLTQQHLKLKKHKYLQQRTNGFNIRQLQSLETISQNKRTLVELLRCLKNEIGDGKSTEAFQLYEKRQFNIGDWVDIRDVSGLWVQGQIVGKYSHFIEIKYNGYPDRWNEWIPHNSQRILPFRTQTVQNDSTPYLSPFPMVKPQLQTHVQTPGIEPILSNLPDILQNISKLINQMQFSTQKQQQNNNHGQNNEYEDCGQSFKNNRSHDSPRQSMHEQQYEYQDKIPNNRIQKKQTERNSGSTKGGNKKKIIYGRYPQKYGILSYNKTKSEREHDIGNRQNTQIPNINSSSNFMKPDQHVHAHTPNTLHKKIFFNSEKVQQDHSQYLPDDDEIPKKQKYFQSTHQIQQEKSPSIIQNKLDEMESQDNELYQTHNQDLEKINKATSYKSNSSKNASIKPIPEDNNEHMYNETYPNETSLIILPQNNIVDNISNKCNEENISNKGEQDNDDISAKSFKSKRSQGLVDTASMKSLIIGTYHDNYSSHQKANRKNILFVDHSQAQSVRETKKNEQGKFTYYQNQQDILEQQDSQINQQNLSDFPGQYKRDLQKKLRATQLAPLMDRLGRMMVDMAPHVAMLGFTQQYISSQINQNLSTYTNQGSLQSRIKNFTKINTLNSNIDYRQDRQSIKQVKDQYWNFQVPVMLTPWEILQLNRLLEKETDNPNPNQ